MSDADGTQGQAPGDAFAGLRATMRRLVWPGGCAWHEVQTHESLTPFLVEEAAELIDGIEHGLPAEEVAGELGDVLYQVLFHAAIAERDGEGYDFDSVAAALDRKLIARHPHVFGDRGYMSVAELNAEWERLKEDAAGERRGSRGVLEGIPAGMPTLARTAKVVERLKRAGVLEPAAGSQGEAAAIHREIGREHAGEPEVRNENEIAAVGETDRAAAEALIGDAMLALVRRANAEGVDPDRALRIATERFAAARLSGEPGEVAEVVSGEVA